ncbi:MAG TPA: hypothetical protein V6D14_15405 [Coleofasciculaceae cyanobacterium]|jgi:hypothetical protein
MFKIELLLRNSNLTLRVHRKAEAEANALLEESVTAMNSEKIHLLRLSCDSDARLKTAVFNNDLMAVSLSGV